MFIVNMKNFSFPIFPFLAPLFSLLSHLFSFSLPFFPFIFVSSKLFLPNG